MPRLRGRRAPALEPGARAIGPLHEAALRPMTTRGAAERSGKRSAAEQARQERRLRAFFIGRDGFRLTWLFGTPMATLRAGEKIGKYELLHPIGEGGMGEVWVGRLRSLGGFESYVAVKVIHGRFGQEKRFRDMFLDEARVSALISHPNVVSTQDLAVSGEMLYQVMEYVDGDSLASLQSDMAERGERMPLPVALRIAAEVCSGLHAAHELALPDGRHACIVHRDVSPQNVLLGANGAVKLIDFGVALMQGRLAEDSQGSLKGKLRYMPPEQAKGEKVDRRADIYAIGAVLYEMVAGRLPFDDRTEALYFRSLIQGDPPEPLPEDVPAEVRAVVSKAMAVDPQDRFATADQMAEELFSILRKRPANIASFVEIHLSPRAHRRREVVRGSAGKGGETDPSVPVNPVTEADHAVGPSGLVRTAPPTSIEPASSATPAHIGPDLLREVSLSVASPSDGAFGDTALLGSGAAMSRSHGLTRESQGLGGFPEVPSLDLDRPGKKSAAMPAAPATGALSKGVSPEAASVSVARPVIASASSVRVPAQPPAKTTTLMDPTPRRVQSVTGTHERGSLLGGDFASRRSDQEAAAKGGRAVRRALAVVGTVALLVVAVVFSLPILAKRKIILAASERGLELEIARVEVGLSGVDLFDVHAKGPGLPLKAATLTSVKIATNGKVTVRGAEVAVEGPMADLPAALAKLSAGKGSFELDVTEAHVTWTLPLGHDSAFEAKDLRLAFSREEGADGIANVTAYAPDLVVSTARGNAGPFTLNIDESEGRKRVRIVFEARKADGPNVFFIFGGGSSPTHVTLRVPKTKLSALHVPPAYLGLGAGADPELDVLAVVTIEPDGRLKGDGKASISGITIAGSRTKTPLDLEFAIFAEPNKPFEVTKGVASYGPITADFGGLVGRDPVAGDLRFVSKALPCSYFVGAEAKKSLGVVGALAVELFGRAIRVTGAVNVRGTYSFALADLAAARLKLDVRDTCGVVLFPN